MIRSRVAADPPLTLRAETAADLLMPNPVSIPETALVQEAITLLTEKGFSAAPVIDEAGRPVGVLSRTDLLIHDREQGGAPAPAPTTGRTWTRAWDSTCGRAFRSGTWTGPRSATS
jgi:hypothetical protein